MAYGSTEIGRKTLRNRSEDFLKFKEAKSTFIHRFKSFFIKELERILSERPQVVPNEEGIHSKIKIVDAVFAFKNGHILKKLQERGNKIINADENGVA